jgi:hypothetical protein
MMLPPGHKIGEPSPMVEKIKPATIAQLKVGNDTLVSDDKINISEQSREKARKRKKREGWMQVLSPLPPLSPAS